MDFYGVCFLILALYGIGLLIELIQAAANARTRERQKMTPEERAKAEKHDEDHYLTMATHEYMTKHQRQSSLCEGTPSRSPTSCDDCQIDGCPNRLSTLYFQSGSGVWRSLVAHLLWEQRVAGSNPVTPTIRGGSSIGRAAAFQAACCGFESRPPLHCT